MMKIQPHLLLLLLGVCMVTATFAADSEIGDDFRIASLNRSSFPARFIFGSGSASYQFEGAAFEDGKGKSIWDTFTHKFPAKIADRSNGDVTDDQYHQYKGDVKIMKDTGLDAYRFSISWSRILPYGKVSKGVNWKGVKYYHNLIDELLANGVTPFVTLFHWDLPQALEDAYGGFRNRRIVDDFQGYAEFCFKEYGGKVKYWTTLNEPLSFSIFGYAAGTFAPGRCSAWMNNNCTGGNSATEPYKVTHNLILAHAAAVHSYRTKYQAYQKGTIGITLVTHWFVPFSNSQQDRQAAIRAVDFFLGWFLNPLVKGDYPPSMKQFVQGRLPRFTPEESMKVKGSFDFIGMNYYTSQYARYNGRLKAAKPNYLTDAHLDMLVEKNGVPIGPPSASGWLKVYPKGIRDLLIYVKDRYGNPPVYITENGIDDFKNLTLAQALDDKMRVVYHQEHLDYLNRAIKDGVNLKGYFAWSFLDDFEWDAGFTVGFGLNYVDRKNGLKRYQKLSAHWFKKFLRKY